MSSEQQRVDSDEEEILEMDFDEGGSRDSWNELMNREETVNETTAGTSHDSYANVVCKNLPKEKNTTENATAKFEVSKDKAEEEDEKYANKRDQQTRVFTRRRYGQGGRPKRTERATLREYLDADGRYYDSKHTFAPHRENNESQWPKYNSKQRTRNQERFNRRPYYRDVGERMERSKPTSREASPLLRKNEVNTNDQWYKQPVAVPFPPPLFERLLSNQTSLSRLQREETVVNPLNSLNVVDGKDSKASSFTMFLLTHGKINLTYSYKNVSLYEKDLVGVSLFTKHFATGSASNGGIHGLVFRKYQNEYVSYEDYQERLNTLVVRDKFFNERNLEKLQHRQTTHSPMDALRVLEKYANDSTVYSVCEIPLSVHMLSVSFPSMLEYLRSRNIRIIGHRLSPRLTWIANAFVDYSSLNGFEIKAMKFDLSNCNKIPIHPDCYARDNHTSSTCEVCVFHNYSRAFESLMNGVV